MALQLFAGDLLVYDSRLEDYSLQGLTTVTGLNKGGTAEIVMPQGHPAYNAFISYRTIVTLYENGALRFRGRALYPSDDFWNTRTITCEGERCFFRDGIIRPYLFQNSPAAIFAAALELYNTQVDDFKRFRLGEITVTDANDYVRFESESAQTFADFFDKLVERCGGYITFSTAEDGGRVVNWLAELDTQSNQAIEFGENLLEFERSGQSDELATAILPYGAQQEDGTRITIETVTEDSSDWIQDDEAVALRGLIMATETWDDVTEPENLLIKAREWLEEHKMAVTSLQLTAADLSRMDRSIDSFHVGDRVRVISTPHSVDDWFQLTERTIDWLDPAGGSITLGKTQASLIGADVINQRTTSGNITRVQEHLTELSKETKEGLSAGTPKAAEEISEVANLDAYKSPGFYVFSSAAAATMENSPVAEGSGSVEVFREGDSGQVRQVVTRCSEDSREIWERLFYLGTWHPWQCIYKGSTGSGRVLWSGALQMQEEQTATLTEPISTQPNGVVLVFSELEDDAASGQAFYTQVIPKYMVAAHTEATQCVQLTTSDLAYFGTKRLCVRDCEIVGHADNNTNGVGACGIAYTNSRFVLRYVIGI